MDRPNTCFVDAETAIVEAALDGIIAMDANGIVRRFNPAAERLFGWNAAEIVGQSVTLLMAEPHRSRHDGYVRCYLEGQAPRVIGRGREVEGVRRDGSSFPLYLAVTEADSRGERLFIGILRDLTLEKRQEAALLERQEMMERYIRDLEFTRITLEEQAALLADMAERIDGEKRVVEEAKRQVEHAAHHDSLTGLANRLYFNKLLRTAVDRDQPFALLYVDLDRFKAVNDCFGHDAGDSLLRTVSVCLSGAVGGRGVAVRLGGDEFAVLLQHGGGTRDTIVGFAADLLERLRIAVTYGGQTIQVGSSIGVAFFPDHGREGSSLIKAADQAMYASKQAGRNRVTVAEQ